MFIGRPIKVLIRVEIQDENLHRKSFNNELFCEIYNKMENKKFYTVRTIPKSNIKIVLNILNTQIHDRTLSWLN